MRYDVRLFHRPACAYPDCGNEYKGEGDEWWADPYDGEFCGRAAITSKNGRAHVDAWADNTYECAVFPKPDWTAEYGPNDLLSRCPYCGQP